MRAEFRSGNSLTLLESGTAYFPELIAAIEAASAEVHIETYIFADDDTGRRVAAALCRAARRGVAIRVLVDGFGARQFPETLGRALAADGVEVLVYRPEVARLSFRRHRLRRLHRKLAIIDATVAFVGGINVIDDMDTPGQVPPRLDYAVRITGPLVPSIHRAMHRLWALVRWANFHRREWPRGLPPAFVPTGDVEAALVLRDNVRHRRDIEEAYLEAIEQAEYEVVLASAYFLPGMRFRHALTDAAQRGVKVILPMMLLALMRRPLRSIHTSHG
jgi:cardiolipin synthase